MLSGKSIHHLLDEILNGPAHYTVRHHFDPVLTLVFVLGILLAEFIGVYLIFMALVKTAQNTRSWVGWILRHCGAGEANPPRTFLELTFPAVTSKSAYATEQLHILMRTVAGYNGTLDQLAAHKKPYSLELFGAHDDGIRFVLLVPTGSVSTVSHNLLSFLPGLKIRPVEDYLSRLTGITVGVIELQLSGDFVLPLQDHKVLDEHDLMAYLTGHMTKLLPGELVAFQIVATPIYKSTHGRTIRHIHKMEGLIALNKELATELVKQRTPLGYIWWLMWYPPAWLIEAMGKVVVSIVGILDAAFSREHDLPDFMKSSKAKRSATNPYEQELGRTVKSKLDQHLYEVTMRILVASDDPTTINDRLSAITDSFKPFTSKYQSIQVRKNVPLLLPAKHNLAKFKARALSPHHLSQQTVLSSSELSDLYHLPNTDLTKTEGLVKSRSSELPAPLSIKHSATELDVIVGTNQYGGEHSPIGLTLEQRRKPTYIIGKTGTGKTTLLKQSIYQDMVSGKGLAVLDPHGDLFNELLEIIPKHRQKDVIVFNPADRANCIGLNMLAPGIHFEDEEVGQEQITSTVLSIFKKLSEEAFWGPRMEHILQSVTLTALQLPNPNLYHLQRLLTNKAYQRDVARTLKDPVLKLFWKDEMAMYGDMQLASLAQPLTNRLGHFITTKMSRNILMQQKSTINISDIMDEGKILLVNLSKGKLGEDQSNFFGTILSAFIWTAAYQRIDKPEHDRRDFFVYIDEFQNFATPQFSDITSEARKFRVIPIISHQNIAQIKDKALLQIMTGNASTMISLKASPDDEAFILPYLEPAVGKGDIVNLPPHHFFMKTTAEESEDAFSGITVPLKEPGSTKTRDAVVAYSQKHYATPRKKVEAYLDELIGEDAEPDNEQDSGSHTSSRGEP